MLSEVRQKIKSKTIFFYLSFMNYWLLLLWLLLLFSYYFNQIFELHFIMNVVDNKSLKFTDIIIKLLFTYKYKPTLLIEVVSVSYTFVSHISEFLFSLINLMIWLLLIILFCFILKFRNFSCSPVWFVRSRSSSCGMEPELDLTRTRAVPTYSCLGRRRPR